MDNSRFEFRGKRVDNGEWVEGSIMNVMRHSIDGDAKYIYPYDNGHPYSSVATYHEVIPDTVGQCTGEPSEEGKGPLVFEGDKVEITDGDGWVVGEEIIKWDNYFDFNNCDGRCFGKIIGNIHE